MSPRCHWQDQPTFSGAGTPKSSSTHSAHWLGWSRARSSKAGRGRRQPAVTYRDLGRLDEALPLLQRALQITETALGPNHPTTAILLNNLAVTYRALGRRMRHCPCSSGPCRSPKPPSAPTTPPPPSGWTTWPSPTARWGGSEALPLRSGPCRSPKPPSAPTTPPPPSGWTTWPSPTACWGGPTRRCRWRSGRGKSGRDAQPKRAGRSKGEPPAVNFVRFHRRRARGGRS